MLKTPKFVVHFLLKVTEWTDQKVLKSSFLSTVELIYHVDGTNAFNSIGSHLLNFRAQNAKALMTHLMTYLQLDLEVIPKEFSM